MTAYVIRNNNWENGVTWYSFVMYHGVELEAPASTASTHSNSTAPVDLLINAVSRPDIVMPIYDVFCSPDAVARLGELPCVSFLPVQRCRFFSQEFQMNDNSFFNGTYYLADPMNNTPDRFAASLPLRDAPPSESYKQLKVANIHRLRPNGQKLHMIYNNQGQHQEVNIPLDPDILQEHPVLQSQHGLLLSEKAMQAAGHYFPFPFYFVQALQVA